MKPIYWTAYCYTDRITAIGEVENIVAGFGFITGFQRFSDFSISLMIELEEKKIDNLYNALGGCLSLDDSVKLNSASDTERLILMNITFVKGTGNLRIEVPAVPG
jgi:hypothetical protein